jgi:hypothetical protein
MDETICFHATNLQMLGGYYDFCYKTTQQPTSKPTNKTYPNSPKPQLIPKKALLSFNISNVVLDNMMKTV